jgi:hypothetical protein
MAMSEGCGGCACDERRTIKINGKIIGYQSKARTWRLKPDGSSITKYGQFRGSSLSHGNALVERRNANNELESINDQPSVLHADHSKKWHKKGLLHRENDKPAQTYKTGRFETQRWYRYGGLHRWKGPAIITKHRKIWALYGIEIISLKNRDKHGY